MGSHLKRVRGALLTRLAVTAATGLAVAACSTDMTRFDGNPFRQDVTNTVPAAPPPQQAQVPGHQLPPRNHVETQPLNQPNTPPNAQYRPQSVPAAPAPQANTRTLQGPQTTASVRGEWSPEGGTAITVQNGETIYSLARKHNVPVNALLQANNLQTATTLRTGQRIIIPARRNAQNPSVAAPQAAGSHTVNAGDTIFSLSRRYKVSPQSIASANNLTLTTQLKVGQRLTIPGAAARNPVVNNAPQSLPPATPQKRAQFAPPPAAPQTANPPIINQAENVPAPETVGMVRPNVAPSVAPEAAPNNPNAGPSFRWPVRGRIISAFGKKPNGQQNDGINLSVPEGTPIRAAEDGVVAYAGNELKGFGNLVLIRHANNWVTAYAHTSSIDVKKDQKVKRGDIIAKAGSTGGVTGPQLHFEIRRGSTPVDPEKHLGGT